MAHGPGLTLDIAEKRWPGRDQPLFSGLRLAIAPGEVLAVLGPSGVGKSTLLRLVAGIDTRFSGRIEIDGQPASAAPAPGMVFQDPRLLPWLTARDNIAALLPGRSDAQAAADAALAAVGLAADAETFPLRLSGGMQRRLALARALAANPRLFLLDEPFVSLDPALHGQMRRLVGDLLASTGATAILVTHSAEDAAHLATRAVILGGRPATIRRDLVLAGHPSARSADAIAALVDDLTAVPQAD